MNPKPETKRAFLWSEGKRKFTWHTYIGTYECWEPYRLTPGEEKVGGPGWEHVFECDESHAQRRWGFESRKDSGHLVEVS